MTIHCKLCGHTIQPRGPDATAAGMEEMVRHLLSHHNRDAAALKQDIDTLHVLLASYLLIKNYVRIPPQETELQKHFGDLEQSLVNLFAFEPRATN